MVNEFLLRSATWVLPWEGAISGKRLVKSFVDGAGNVEGWQESRWLEGFRNFCAWDLDTREPGKEAQAGMDSRGHWCAPAGGNGAQEGLGRETIVVPLKELFVSAATLLMFWPLVTFIVSPNIYFFKAICKVCACVSLYVWIVIRTCTSGDYVCICLCVWERYTEKERARDKYRHSRTACMKGRT